MTTLVATEQAPGSSGSMKQSKSKKAKTKDGDFLEDEIPSTRSTRGRSPVEGRKSKDKSSKSTSKSKNKDPSIKSKSRESSSTKKKSKSKSRSKNDKKKVRTKSSKGKRDKSKKSKKTKKNESAVPHRSLYDVVLGFGGEDDPANSSTSITSRASDLEGSKHDDKTLMSIPVEIEGGWYTPPSEELPFEDKRPVVLDSLLFTIVYLIAIFLVLTFAWVIPVITETIEDHYYRRLGWFLLLPLSFGMMLFPFKLVIFNTLGLFGSYKNINRNSTNHSAIAPPVPAVLPRVLVQMPIYKESFSQTIKPSLDDIFQAIYYYRERGGEADVFVNDDGLQLISEEDCAERIAYYNEHGIAYVARPPPAVLERRGLFKKASNMNFCINFALDVDKEMETTNCDNETAMQRVMDSRPYTVVAGGPVTFHDLKNILLVDSDTRVPKKCLHQTVGEFDICTNLAFCQHAISVLRVDYNCE